MPQARRPRSGTKAAIGAFNSKLLPIIILNFISLACPPLLFSGSNFVSIKTIALSSQCLYYTPRDPLKSLHRSLVVFLHFFLPKLAESFNLSNTSPWTTPSRLLLPVGPPAAVYLEQQAMPSAPIRITRAAVLPVVVYSVM